MSKRLLRVLLASAGAFFLVAVSSHTALRAQEAEAVSGAPAEAVTDIPAETLPADAATADPLAADAAALELAVAPELSAQTPEQLVAGFGEASFNEKVDISRALAATGHEEAVNILNALVAGTLYAHEDGRIFYGPAPDGSFTDGLLGYPDPDVTTDMLDKITVNNRVRREVRGFAARLSLMSPDAGTRYASASSAFNAADPDSLPFIEEAIAMETNARTRARLEQARIVILLKDENVTSETIMSSLPILRERGDQGSLNVLLAIESDDPVVMAEVNQIVEGINSSLAYWGVLQNIIYGLSLGSVLLLAAVGLAITFGVMGVINMAHGEMIMIGAYSTFVVQSILLANAPGLMEYSLLFALPVAFLVSGAAGVAVERGIIRFLYGRPLETLLATWGLSLILQQTVRSVFGPTNKAVIAPQFMSGAFDLGLLTITYSRLWIFIFCFIVLGAMFALLRLTKFGLQMRAVTQNRKMASSMGIRTDWVDALTFGLGSGIAGLAGVALTQIDNVGPNLGQSYIIDSFMVVVFGGVGNLWGTLVGAMSLGVLNKFLEPYAGAVLGKILVLVLIILFIQRRPRGLFALKGRAVEA